MEKGAIGHFLGSVFADLVVEHQLAGPRQSMQKQCIVLNSMAQAFYDRCNVRDRMHEITLNTFMAKSVTSEAPFFNLGNMSKVRALVKFALELAELLLDRTNHRGVHRLEAAKTS